MAADRDDDPGVGAAAVRQPALPTSPHVALVHDNFTGPTGMGWVTENHAR